MEQKKSSSKFYIFILVLSLLGLGSWYVFNTVFKTNVHLNGKKSVLFYVPTGTDFDGLVDLLKSENILDDDKSFIELATKLKLPEHVHPGRYRIMANMSNRQLVKLFKEEKQELVKLTLTAQQHYIEDVIQILSNKLEMKEDDLADFFTNETELNEQYGLNKETAICIVNPDTYERKWNTSQKEFFDDLYSDYKSFWNAERLKKCKAMNLSATEVMTLASIVQHESNIGSEQKRIAGVYYNRLKKDMLLQADPTLKFANHNWEAQRILDSDKEVDSPYNTYKNKGLPPGPLGLVTHSAIDNTLNYEHSKYIFFCARPDNSGFSNFSTTYEQHQKHAEAYQSALDKKKILR